MYLTETISFKQQQPQHGLMSKMDPYTSSSQSTVASSLTKQDGSLGVFSAPASVPSPSPVVVPQVSKVATGSGSGSATYPYGPSAGYSVPSTAVVNSGAPGNVSASQQTTSTGSSVAQPAGAYPSNSQPMSGNKKNIEFMPRPTTVQLFHTMLRLVFKQLPVIELMALQLAS